MSSHRSGVFIVCDSAESGLRVRAVPGFAYDPILGAVEPLLEFAFDGKRILEAHGKTGAVGDNVATAETRLTGEQAQQFVRAFAAAQRQVAIKDGISDQPHLLRATGSTKSGQVLLTCLGKQPADSNAAGPLPPALIEQLSRWLEVTAKPMLVSLVYAKRTGYHDLGSRHS